LKETLSPSSLTAGFLGALSDSLFPCANSYSGGWKDRRLEFGKEDGLSTAALVPYIGTHKLASVVSPVDKIKAAWDNAAHATVTGVGLLYITKFKNLEVPINVINLVCSSPVKLRSHILGRYH